MEQVDSNVLLDDLWRRIEQAPSVDDYDVDLHVILARLRTLNREMQFSLEKERHSVAAVRQQAEQATEQLRSRRIQIDYLRSETERLTNAQLTEVPGLDFPDGEQLSYEQKLEMIKAELEARKQLDDEYVQVERRKLEVMKESLERSRSLSDLDVEGKIVRDALRRFEQKLDKVIGNDR